MRETTGNERGWVTQLQKLNGSILERISPSRPTELSHLLGLIAIVRGVRHIQTEVMPGDNIYRVIHIKGLI
jgi:hypothetical protein